MSQTEHYDKLPCRDLAPPRLRIQMPLTFRRFYADRPLSTLAAKALIGEARRMVFEHTGNYADAVSTRGPAKVPGRRHQGKYPLGWRTGEECPASEPESPPQSETASR